MAARGWLSGAPRSLHLQIRTCLGVTVANVSIDPAPVHSPADGPFTVPEHLRAEQLADRMGSSWCG
jgi:hypothetical protein